MNITEPSGMTPQVASTAADIEVAENLKLNQWLMVAERSKAETLWRTEADEDYKFYAGDQDTTDVKAQLLDQKRPDSVYNEIKPKVDMLIGLAAQARRVPDLVPVGSEDEALTEVMNGVLGYHRNKCKVSRKEMEAFSHMVKGGKSYVYPYIGGENPFVPEQKIFVLNGRDVLVDPDSVEYDLSDARYAFISRWYDEDAIKANFQKFDPLLIRNFSQIGSGTHPSYFNEGNDKYRLIEGWYFRYEKVTWFMNPMTNKVEFMSKPNFENLQRALMHGLQLPDGRKMQINQPLQGVENLRKQCYLAVFSGPLMLKYNKSPYKHNKIPLVLFGAYKDFDNNRWFGSITMAKDPQRALNTTRRQLVHLLQVSPKGILMHEAGVILNIEEYEDRSSEPNYHMELQKGGLEKVKFSTQPQISPIYGQLDELFSQSIKNVVGTQDALLGIQTSSREPGVTMQMRQETGIAVLYIIFENFRQSRLNLAEFMVSLIQQYETMERVIRIQGPEGAKLLQVNSQMNPQTEGFNDVSFGEFDAVIDENVENTTMRAFAMQMLSQFGQNNPGTIPPDLLMEYSNMPYSAKMKVRDYNQQQQQVKQAMDDREYQLKVEELKIKMIAAENKGQSSDSSGSKPKKKV
jgi:hypothetical protein